MAQAFALPGGERLPLALAARSHDTSATAALERLPGEWSVVDTVVLRGRLVDHVVVGPNGLFAVTIDPAPDPATLGEDGIYRNGRRVAQPVEDALMAAFELRAVVGSHLFAYPILVTPLTGQRARLDRLGVVSGDRLAELIWSHPGRPLRRSQRREASWALRKLVR